MFYPPIAVAVWVLRHLRHDVADRIALAIARVAWRLPTRSRRNIIRNVAAAIAAPEHAEQTRRTARRAWENQALNFADNIRVVSESAESILHRTELVGLEHLCAALVGGRGAIIASAHLGNVDFAGHATMLHGIRATAVVQDIRSERLFRLLNDVRVRFGGEMVRARPGLIGELQRRLRDGQCIGFTCDWDSVGNGVPVPFLGHQLRLPVGPPLLALRTGAPVVPGYVIRLPGNRYQVRYHPPLDVVRTGVFRRDLAALAAAIGQAIESYIRQFPEQWCCFQDIWYHDGAPANAPQP